MLFKLVFGEVFDTKRAYLYLFLLLLPNLIFLNNQKIWDDSFVFESHSVWSLHALLGPYLDQMVFKQISYWRPLTVLTIAIPDLIGIPVWGNKLISVALFFVQGCLAISVASNNLKSKDLPVSSLPIIILAVVLALHPVFVETTLWISARADLLMGVFVLLGVYWADLTRTRETLRRAPESTLKGFLRGFLLTWLICGAKDSGIVWVGMGLLVILYFGYKGSAEWKKYWWHWAGGTAIAMYSYLNTRNDILTQFANLAGNGTHVTGSFGEAIQLFAEFIIRALVNIFLPFLDQAPFKSAGWFAGVPLLATLLVLVCTFAITGFLVFQVRKRNRQSAWLLLFAIVIILFHATLEACTPSTYGAVLATRYLAPETILIYVALALLLLNQTAVDHGDISKNINAPVAAIFAIVVLQSLAIWTDTRLGWSSKMGLWESSWDHGSRSRVVAEGYSSAYFDNKDFLTARKIAQYWINQNQDKEAAPKLCLLYVDILNNDVILNDHEDGIRYANRALPIGSCHPSLAKNIAYFLMKDQCRLAVPVLYLAIAEGDSPAGVGIWRFKNSTQRAQFFVTAAYGEERCGDHNRALQLLDEVSQTEKSWAPDGEKARKFLKSAHD